MVKDIEPLASTCQLKVTLMGTKPAIWRRLRVPGNANLGGITSAEFGISEANL